MIFKQSLFWDVDPKKIDAKKNAQYIIERIADYGGDKETRWMLNYYKKPFIKKIIAKSRCLTPEAKNLWSLLLKNH